MDPATIHDSATVSRYWRDRPRAAHGHIPFAHRTVAQVDKDRVRHNVVRSVRR